MMHAYMSGRQQQYPRISGWQGESLRPSSSALVSAVVAPSRHDASDTMYLNCRWCFASRCSSVRFLGRITISSSCCLVVVRGNRLPMPDRGGWLVAVMAATVLPAPPVRFTAGPFRTDWWDPSPPHYVMGALLLWACWPMRAGGWSRSSISGWLRRGSVAVTGIIYPSVHERRMCRLTHRIEKSPGDAAYRLPSVCALRSDYVT